MKNLNIQKVQKGFTLIELMIVIAIIGILASLAIPAYQDYTTRAKIGETASITSTAKTAIALAFSEGTLANGLTNSDFGLADIANITSKYVKDVEVKGTSTTSGTIEAEVQGTNTTQDGQSVIWVATCVTGAQCSWSVNTSTVAAKFLPKP